MSFITVYGMIVFFVCLSSRFDTGNYDKWKALMFVIFGISTAVGIVHANLSP
jgi:hypothetical protein